MLEFYDHPVTEIFQDDNNKALLTAKERLELKNKQK